MPYRHSRAGGNPENGWIRLFCETIKIANSIFNHLRGSIGRGKQSGATPAAFVPSCFINGLRLLGLSFIKNRQLFLCGILSAANLFLVCQFKLKAVCQGMPACFDDIFYPRLRGLGLITIETGTPKASEAKNTMQAQNTIEKSKFFFLIITLASKQCNDNN